MSGSRRLVLVGPAPPLRGGIAHFGTALARALAEGHDVQKISFRRQYPTWLFPGRTQTQASGETIDGSTPAVLDSLRPWTWGRAARLAAVREPHAAVLMHWTPFLAPTYAGFARALQRECGGRSILLCHNLRPHEPGPLDRILTVRLLRSVAGAVALSPGVEADLRAAAPGLPVRRVAHPVVGLLPDPPSRAAARERLGLGDELVLLFFGLVRRYKGLETLLQALPEITRHRRCRLLVAGEFYEPRRRYEELAAGLRLGDTVTFLDRYAPDGEVPALFAAADLCVLPYHAASQSGVSKLALQFGTPVVVTDVGGLPDDVEEGVTGYVVPPRNAGAMATAVERFCRDRKGHDFAAAIAARRADFSWAPLVEAIEALA